MNRILFICNGAKKPDYTPSGSGYSVQPAGLANSARLVVEMLNKQGIEAKLVHVVDNDDIDRVVTEFRPTLVVIEALWVVPSKFIILKELHPTVKWMVRLHSEIPFIACEGIAIQWVKAYLAMDIKVTANSRRMQRDMGYLVGDESIGYTPNYYYPEHVYKKKHDLKGTTALLYTDDSREDLESVIHVGCFGAIRLLKNHLIQAVAAMRYADKHDLTLVFHINGAGQDSVGKQIYKNIEHLFENTKHFLIDHGWYSHADFLSLLECIDVGMQVSLSETFNIVTADLVHLGKPVVVSDEVSWISGVSKVDASDVDSIVAGLEKVLRWSKLGIPEYLNARALRKHAKHSIRAWKKYLDNQ